MATVSFTKIGWHSGCPGTTSLVGSTGMDVQLRSMVKTKCLSGVHSKARSEGGESI